MNMYHLELRPESYKHISLSCLRFQQRGCSWVNIFYIISHCFQTFKERGEIISKLQEIISENEIKISQISEENQSIQKELHYCKTNLISKEDLLKCKEATLKELETEIIKIKEAQENNTGIFFLHLGNLKNTRSCLHLASFLMNTKHI